MPILRSALAALAALVLAAAAWCQSPPAAAPVPFATFAADFRAAHGVTATDPAACDAQALLARDWLGGTVGAIDVLYPRLGLEAKARQEELRAMVGCILDLHAVWLEWFGNGPAAEAARADVVLLKKWLGGARVQAAKLADPSSDLFAGFGAAEKELAALARVNLACQDGSAFGYAPKTDVRWKLMLAPTRREFLDLVAFFGWVDPANQGSFWDDGAARWTETYWNSIQVLSLEDPPGKPDPSAPYVGTSMNAKAATGAAEHVATRAAHTLCTTYYGFALDAAFESGLCQNAAIAIYGRNNARSGGGGRGNSTDGWSMFVPGGQKQGGRLPGMSADSPWRATEGADHFVKPLRDSQRVASKDASKGTEKTSTFELTANDHVKKHFIRAPFLGAAAAAHELPAQEFLADYGEFFRAYKSCFVHWLAETGGGKPAKASRAKLAQLLRTVAAAGEGASFEALIGECYGMPWSGAESKPESLEWSFLAWLSRQK